MDKPKVIPTLQIKPVRRPFAKVCCETNTKSGPGEAAASRWTLVISKKPCQNSIKCSEKCCHLHNSFTYRKRGQLILMPAVMMVTFMSLRFAACVMAEGCLY